ncbi:MAG: Molybdopterin-synthase adenylyltransferase [Deltaproteobacteria bacterium ADurb.Bin151]|jgi:adenylyltransferase/sulfurtransferase|nr:HesA/MoeB/ThiF family protein [Smithellaceae bacterium]NLD81063.1 HesA/MoeB/ThiF family protein [Smithella sp.]OQB55799.1 MAG: Molybdopterin-synthase adenylyltransferase [Deltaproteobacteria bacterium ADurb.Bin151]HOQ43358.1 HesA/MoeB/ThiF family protein [Smithellaceae bacterium]HPL68086.1 HesA/MoeB/ThiF family protein [Smithellaceae bacterium]
MTKYNIDRYQRQITLLGEEGQESLRRARVLVAGVGGLGTIVAADLAAAGVGFLRLADNDRVELSNLNRQFLFRPDDIGREKTLAAMERLHLLNPEIQVEGISQTIDNETINELVKDIDLIVDAMDNFATRFILNQAAFSRHLPMIHGAVRGFFGQATTLIPGKTGCLQCFFAGNPLGEIIPVIGATCGVIGSVQASETIKVLTGRGEPLTNRLFFWDGWAGEGTVIDAKRNPRCIICGGG